MILSVVFGNLNFGATYKSKKKRKFRLQRQLHALLILTHKLKSSPVKFSRL